MPIKIIRRRCARCGMTELSTEEDGWATCQECGCAAWNDDIWYITKNVAALIREVHAPAPKSEEPLPDVWIRVTDLRPPAGKDVWCYNQDGWQFQGRCMYDDASFFTVSYGDSTAPITPFNKVPDRINVTHWRRLPEPPK